MYAPKLRFKKFNEEWKKNTLFYMLDNEMITEHIDGNHGELYPKSEEFVDIGVPYISANSLLNGNVDYSKVKFLTLERAKQFKKGVCKPDDLLFAHNATVGPVAIIDEKYPLSIISTTLTLYRINQELLNNIFIKVYMESSAFIKQYSSVMKQSTRNQVPITMQRNFYFPIIDLEEQNKIASFFKLIDKKIQLQQEKINLLKEQKKGYMQKIFSQELRFKYEKGVSYQEWEERYLKELSDVRDGTHDSPKYCPTGYPLITSKNLNSNGTLNSKDLSYISQDDYEKINKRSLVEDNDILFGMIGTIGNAVKVSNPNFAIKNVALIKDTTEKFNEFLIHFLTSFHIEKQFKLLLTGGTQKFIGLNDIRNLNVLVPCQDEQKKIAQFLSAIDKKIALNMEKLNRIIQQKQAFMQQMFI